MISGRKKPGITLDRDAVCENPAGMLNCFYEYLCVSPLHVSSALTGGGTFVEDFETVCTTAFNAVDERLVAFGYTVFFRILGTMVSHILILLDQGLRGLQLDALPEEVGYGFPDFGF